MARTTPYSAFNFTVKFDGSEEFGGFSDVSGLGLEMTVAEYREGNDPENHVRKVPGMHKVTDVLLKRGIVNSASLWKWIKQVRTEGVAAAKSVTITMMDESRNGVQSWVLSGVTPMKYTGPTLAAKGGTDVAMEELTLCVEGIDIQDA